jgi:hypothetical protein
MSGIYFLFSLIGMAVIIRWYIRNDDVDAGAPAIGVLRADDEIRTPEDPQPSSSVSAS